MNTSTIHPCSVCGAKENDPCVGATGRKRKTVHAGRSFSVEIDPTDVYDLCKQQAANVLADIVQNRDHPMLKGMGPVVDELERLARQNLERLQRTDPKGPPINLTVKG